MNGTSPITAECLDCGELTGFSIKLSECPGYGRERLQRRLTSEEKQSLGDRIESSIFKEEFLSDELIEEVQTLVGVEVR